MSSAEDYKNKMEKRRKGALERMMRTGQARRLREAREESLRNRARHQQALAVANLKHAEQLAAEAKEKKEAAARKNWFGKTFALSELGGGLGSASGSPWGTIIGAALGGTVGTAWGMVDAAKYRHDKEGKGWGRALGETMFDQPGFNIGGAVASLGDKEDKGFGDFFQAGVDESGVVQSISDDPEGAKQMGYSMMAAGGNVGKAIESRYGTKGEESAGPSVTPDRREGYGFDESPGSLSLESEYDDPIAQAAYGSGYQLQEPGDLRPPARSQPTSTGLDLKRPGETPEEYLRRLGLMQGY